jgi:phosphotriesterase-related protein
MTTVETALGPVATTELGPTLMHEHVVTRSPGVQENWPHLWDRNAILTIAERKMADLYTRASGRSSISPRSISAATSA